MTSDRFDQSAWLVARQDPEGFLAWLFPGLSEHVRFVRWLDTRTASGPSVPALFADTVAELIGLGDPAPPWLMLLEFQTEPDADMFGRLLGELGKFWREHRPDDLPGSRYQMAATVVNLTGTRQSAPASRSYDFPVNGLSLRLLAKARYLEEESARVTLDAIERGEVSTSVLAWIPLMKNGAEGDIIGRWLTLARSEPNARRRDVAGIAALVLAELTAGYGEWAKALKEWNMRESTVVQNWINIGKDEGKKEGLKEGSLERARQILRNLVEARFGSLPPALAARIDACTDADVLSQAAPQVYRVADAGDLLSR